MSLGATSFAMVAQELRGGVRGRGFRPPTGTARWFLLRNWRLKPTAVAKVWGCRWGRDGEQQRGLRSLFSHLPVSLCAHHWQSLLWPEGRAETWLAEFSSNVTKQGAEGQCGGQNSKMGSMILTPGCTCLVYDSYPGVWADPKDVMGQWVPWLGYIIWQIVMG